MVYTLDEWIKLLPAFNLTFRRKKNALFPFRDVFKSRLLVCNREETTNSSDPYEPQKDAALEVQFITNRKERTTLEQNKILCAVKPSGSSRVTARFPHVRVAPFVVSASADEAKG